MAKKALRLLFIVAFLFVNVGCDQATKYAAREYLPTAHGVTFLGGILNFMYIENPGGPLSFGASLPTALWYLVLVIFPVLMLIAMVWYSLRPDCSRLRLVGLLSIASGGLGNLLDRIASRHVPDFINLRFGVLSHIVLNVADLLVFFGVIILCISFFLAGRSTVGSANPPAGPAAE